jgi:hypothetical protein
VGGLRAQAIERPTPSRNLRSNGCRRCIAPLASRPWVSGLPPVENSTGQLDDTAADIFWAAGMWTGYAALCSAIRKIIPITVMPTAPAAIGNSIWVAASAPLSGPVHVS